MSYASTARSPGIMSRQKRSGKRQLSISPAPSRISHSSSGRCSQDQFSRGNKLIWAIFVSRDIIDCLWQSGISQHKDEMAMLGGNCHKCNKIARGGLEKTRKRDGSERKKAWSSPNLGAASLIYFDRFFNAYLVASFIRRAEYRSRR